MAVLPFISTGNLKYAQRIEVAVTMSREPACPEQHLLGFEV